MDDIEKLPIGISLQELKSLVANGHPLAANVCVTVVIANAAERSPIDHGLIAFQARSLLTLVGQNRHGPELDPFDDAPRGRLTFDDAYPVEARVFEGLQKAIFAERAGNAARPDSGLRCR